MTDRQVVKVRQPEGQRTSSRSARSSTEPESSSCSVTNSGQNRLKRTNSFSSHNTRLQSDSFLLTLFISESKMLFKGFLLAVDCQCLCLPPGGSLNILVANLFLFSYLLGFLTKRRMLR